MNNTFPKPLLGVVTPSNDSTSPMEVELESVETYMSLRGPAGLDLS